MTKIVLITGGNKGLGYAKVQRHLKHWVTKFI